MGCEKKYNSSAPTFAATLPPCCTLSGLHDSIFFLKFYSICKVLKRGAEHSPKNRSKECAPKNLVLWSAEWNKHWWGVKTKSAKKSVKWTKHTKRLCEFGWICVSLCSLVCKLVSPEHFDGWAFISLAFWWVFWQSWQKNSAMLTKRAKCKFNER